MKKILYTCILLSILFNTIGCTIQFKAKEIELDGHVDTTYEFERIAWTRKATDL